MTNHLTARSFALGLLQAAIAVVAISASLGLGANGFDGAEGASGKENFGSEVEVGPVLARFTFVPKNLQLRTVVETNTSDVLLRRPISNLDAMEREGMAQSGGEKHKRYPRSRKLMRLRSKRQETRRKGLKPQGVDRLQSQPVPKLSAPFSETPLWALKAFGNEFR